MSWPKHVRDQGDRATSPFPSCQVTLQKKKSQTGLYLAGSVLYVLSVNDAHGISHWCWVLGQTLIGRFVQGTQTSQVKRVLFLHKAKI